MHTGGTYAHHVAAYPGFLSYAPSMSSSHRKSDYGMPHLQHHPHHYLNDSTGTNASSSSPSSHNSSAHLLSYSGYNTGLDLSSSHHNMKRPRSDDDEEDENENESQPSPSPATSVLGDITSASTNQISSHNSSKHLHHMKQDYIQMDSSSSNPALPFKKRARAVPLEQKDSAYYEKRARNNESAKRSRDARRLKESQIQERVTYLEHENSRLLMENQALRYQLSQLHALYGASKPTQ